MTCKDCIHYEACGFEFFRRKYEEIPFGIDADDCHYFKDKSKIIELPCKVGDHQPTSITTYENKNRYTLQFETNDKEEFLYMKEKANECADHSMKNTSRRGKWVQGNFLLSQGEVCSLCDYDSRIRRCYFNFCPNCGADMRGSFSTK